MWGSRSEESRAYLSTYLDMLCVVVWLYRHPGHVCLLHLRMRLPQAANACCSRAIRFVVVVVVSPFHCPLQRPSEWPAPM